MAIRLNVSLKWDAEIDFGLLASLSNTVRDFLYSQKSIFFFD
jgi:hypothetical protein